MSSRSRETRQALFQYAIDVATLLMSSRRAKCLTPVLFFLWKLQRSSPNLTQMSKPNGPDTFSHSTMVIKCPCIVVQEVWTFLKPAASKGRFGSVRMSVWSTVSWITSHQSPRPLCPTLFFFSAAWTTVVIAIVWIWWLWLNDVRPICCSHDVFIDIKWLKISDSRWSCPYHSCLFCVSYHVICCACSLKRKEREWRLLLPDRTGRMLALLLLPMTVNANTWSPYKLNVSCTSVWK